MKSPVDWRKRGHILGTPVICLKLSGSLSTEDQLPVSQSRFPNMFALVFFIGPYQVIAPIGYCYKFLAVCVLLAFCKGVMGSNLQLEWCWIMYKVFLMEGIPQGCFHRSNGGHRSNQFCSSGGVVLMGSRDSLPSVDQQTP